MKGQCCKQKWKRRSTNANVRNDAELGIESTNSQRIMHSQKMHKSLKLYNYQLARNRERKVTKMSKRYGIVNIISYTLAIIDEVNGEKPKNFKEALNNSDK